MKVFLDPKTLDRQEAPDPQIVEDTHEEYDEQEAWANEERERQEEDRSYNHYE